MCLEEKTMRTLEDGSLEMVVRQNNWSQRRMSSWLEAGGSCPGWWGSDSSNSSNSSVGKEVCLLALEGFQQEQLDPCSFHDVLFRAGCVF